MKWREKENWDYHIEIREIEWVLDSEKSAMCEANSNAVLSEVGGFKPCPFCGHTDIDFTEGIDTLGNRMGYLCQCGECGCTQGYYNTEEEAKENWNGRANFA